MYIIYNIYVHVHNKLRKVLFDLGLCFIVFVEQWS